MINVSYTAEIDVLSIYSCPGVCLFVSARENVLFLLLFAFIHALSFLVLNLSYIMFVDFSVPLHC